MTQIRSLPAPTSISQAAQKFLRIAPAITARPMDLPALEKRRRETHALYAPTGYKLLSDLGGTVDEVMLGSVRAQRITPKNAKMPNVILYLFGGGYVQGSPDEDLEITAQLADLTAQRIYAPHYALAPEKPFPAALDDALAAYRVLVDEQGAANITVMGESAGAGLALLTMLAASKAGLKMPRRLVLLSPWSDLSKTGDTLTTLEGCDPSLHYEMTLEPAARAFANGRDLTSPEISPLYAAFSEAFPKTLITTGTRDLFLSDCARLSTKMRASGIDCELRVWEGMWHVFEYYTDLPEAQASLAEIARFITGPG